MRGIVCVLSVLLLCSSVFADLDYGIMIDAGSSGSRIYLYQWPHRDDPSLPLVQPSLINQTVISTKVNGGLSSYVNNVAGAGKSLAPLISYVKKYLPAEKWSTTPLYLKATAGMRALNQSSQDAIMADVRAYLRTSNFSFDDSNARVIPGTDEGVYGWITVNYLQKIITHANPNGASFGALDMGGASTQITFNPSEFPKQYNFSTTLSNTHYDLYTFSYPLGQDQVRVEIINGLSSIQNVDDNGNLVNPCYLQGYSEAWTGNANKSVIGTGDYEGCINTIRRFITQPSETSFGMRNTYQPSIVGKFWAFSGYAYSWQFFNLPSNTTIDQAQHVARSYCGTNFTTVSANYPGNKFTPIYCYTMTYFTELLLQYGFNVNATDQLIVNANVNTTEVTWALGGMIYEANLLPYTAPTSAPTPAPTSTPVTPTHTPTKPVPVTDAPTSAPTNLPVPPTSTPTKPANVTDSPTHSPTEVPPTPTPTKPVPVTPVTPAPVTPTKPAHVTDSPTHSPTSTPTKPVPVTPSPSPIPASTTTGDSTQSPTSSPSKIQIAFNVSMIITATNITAVDVEDIAAAFAAQLHVPVSDVSAFIRAYLASTTGSKRATQLYEIIVVVKTIVDSSSSLANTTALQATLKQEVTNPTSSLHKAVASSSSGVSVQSVVVSAVTTVPATTTTTSSSTPSGTTTGTDKTVNSANALFTSGSVLLCALSVFVAFL